MQALCILLGQEWHRNTEGRFCLDIKSGILLSLWYLATKETFREVGDRFGVSRGHAYRILNKFTRLLSGHASNFIKWPSREEVMDVAAEFNQQPGSYPGVVGCVDGSYIPIPQPSQDAASYYCRKGYHCIILQAVCSKKLIFTDIYVGWPGSVNDARVWRNSPLYQRLVENPESLPPNTHLIGDKAYPLSTFLMVPFKDNGHLTENQRKHNRVLSKTRIAIEHAFGHLKNAFRCLQFLNRIKMQNLKHVVMSTCILHNIRIAENLPIENIELAVENDLQDNENQNIPPNHAAQVKRNELVQMIQNM